MNFHLDLIQDKVEFFEASSLKELERKVNEQIEVNQKIMLGVHSVTHHIHVEDNGRKTWSAVVHFKVRKV
ncbi:DUF2536 family protein [Bacillus carboniphilus]|uniref:DUF2536 family protein n=1 Tax=Bacillus carboniphilus TaxID=86663 RepID=A0ABY9JZ21_9BACI|nr:DUF2536 family protein [Bacillus carboniphilus]WLR44024.1 DUF2536 family protein [Bacillus carboniphilus]